VTDDNFFDISVENGVHQGLKTLSTEIDSTSDVFDEFVIRIFFLEVLDLSFEVFSLFGTTDSRATDSSSLFLFGFISKEFCNRCPFIESMVSSGSERFDLNSSLFIGKRYEKIFDSSNPSHFL
jgi:hypothetical protein